MAECIIEKGGGGADVDAVTAEADHVLKGKIIIDKDGEPLTGTMPDNGAVAPSTLSAGGSYTIPKGYHNGSGKVTVKSLADLTASADATAEQILSGKKAYVDGVLVSGSMTDQGAVSKSITPSTSAQTYTIPKGHHNGSGKVTVAAIPSNYVEISSANFFKGGAFGKLYDVGFVAKAPSRPDSPNVVSTWDGAWENDSNYSLPTPSISDGSLNIIIPHSGKVAMCTKKTIDLSNINNIQVIPKIIQNNLCIWALNPTTKKIVYQMIYTSATSGTKTLLNVSGLTGYCLIGWFTTSTTSGVSAVALKEISLVA